MPHVDVKMLEGRTVEQKRLLVSAFTESMVDILGVSPEAISIAIQEYPAENWANAGILNADKNKAPQSK